MTCFADCSRTVTVSASDEVDAPEAGSLAP